MITGEQIANQYLQEAAAELQHQANRWGDGDIAKLGEVDIEKNMEMDWVGFIGHYSTKWFPGGFRPYKPETLKAFRSSMLKVLCLAISALRWADFYIAQNEELKKPE